MNEYAYYGKGHSIHSSGQIEWQTNIVDDKSVQVGGQQRIITIDGYSMPLMCKGGSMYLKFQVIPKNTDLQTYPSVHLTSPPQWDPSVLDYVHPMGSLTQPMIQLKNSKLIQHLMSLMIISTNYFHLHPKFHQLIIYW